MHAVRRRTDSSSSSSSSREDVETEASDSDYVRAASESASADAAAADDCCTSGSIVREFVTFSFEIRKNSFGHLVHSTGCSGAVQRLMSVAND